jgi:pimeloyl-ACP methyl ester carboxylesterase
MHLQRLADIFKLLAISVLLCLSACSTGSRSIRPSALPTLPAQQKVNRLQIPYPILLLHGLGQKASVWNTNAISFYEKEMGLNHGGIIRRTGKKTVLEEKPNGNTMDFFTLQFSNPVDSVSAWAAELNDAIALVRNKTGADKVILIGYSMGGLASRYYLTKHLNDHHVKRLITIGTPHQGSAFAKAWNWKTTLLNQLNDNPNPLSKLILEQGLQLIRQAESDVPFDAPAVRDLRRPEDGGEFTRRAGLAEHPLDVEYISVIGDVDVLRQTGALNKAGAQELLRRLLSVMGFGIDALFEGGDGVVSARSQTINELPWFRNNPGVQRISQTIKLGSVHEDHLRNSNEIQKISLEDQPEYKGAEFYRLNDKPFIAIEFSDYFPPQKSNVELHIRNAGSMEIIQKVTVPKNAISLVLKPGGIIVSQALIELPEIMDLSSNYDIGIFIRNSFGAQCSAVKTWNAIP